MVRTWDPDTTIEESIMEKPCTLKKNNQQETLSKMFCVSFEKWWWQDSNYHDPTIVPRLLCQLNTVYTFTVLGSHWVSFIYFIIDCWYICTMCQISHSLNQQYLKHILPQLNTTKEEITLLITSMYNAFWRFWINNDPTHHWRQEGNPHDLFYLLVVILCRTFCL